MANVLITAGPTREPLDAVRYLGNRSSGRMGIALANAAAKQNHDTTLLLGPVCFEASMLDQHVKLERFETTRDLAGLLATRQPWFDILIMAAAVADYTPAESTGASAKLERLGAGETLTIELQPTPDLVAAVAENKRTDQRVVAFALEEADKLQRRAIEKMQRKRVDAIVANPLKTMDASDIAGQLFWADGRCDTPGETAMDKPAFARWLIERLVNA